MRVDMLWSLVAFLGIGDYDAPTENAQYTVTSDRLDAIIARWQHNTMSCAPLSGWYCLRRLGHPVTTGELFNRIEISKRGVALDQLVDLLNGFRGVKARAIAVSKKRLDDLPRPCILVLHDQHCIVLDDLDLVSGTAVVFEPTTFCVGEESLDVLVPSWNGIAVVFDTVTMPKTGFLLATAFFAVGFTWIGSRFLPVGRHFLTDSSIVPEPGQRPVACGRGELGNEYDR